MVRRPHAHGLGVREIASTPQMINMDEMIFLVLIIRRDLTKSWRNGTAVI